MTQRTFLDYTGLKRFLSRLKTIIPTKTSELQNDSGYLTQHNPVDSSLSETSENAVQNKVVKGALDGKSDTGHTHSASDVSGLSTVATSGSYNDLSNTPTIPTVNNAKLTIQRNGTTVKTFTANASSNVTANITVPTAVSELTNDSGYLTSASSLDSSKLTGTIDIARLPKGALERLVTVANQTARFALTVNDVQLGDTVKQLDTGVMYIVTDETKLSSADGYTEYTAGSATSVPWSGVTGKPSSFTPSSHTHGNVTNDGKLPTASRALISDSSKNITVSSVTDTELGYLSGVTSAIQTQIDGKANDSSVVHKTGNEDISGTKTFKNSTNVDVNIQKGTSSGSCNIRFNDDTGLSRTVIRSYNDQLEIGHLRNANWYDGAEIILKDNGSSKIKSNNGTVSTEVSFNPDSVKPTNSAIDLGTSTNKWKSVYADSYYLGTTAFGDIATHNASEFSASNHVHGNITNDGKVGTTANKPLITGTGGVIQAGSFGNTANTFCEGNDPRLSDARTPVAHTHVTADVTDLLSDTHTWTSQQSYNSDLNLNYASTDVDDIVNSVAGSATLDNFVHLTGNETVNGIKSFPDGIVANVTGSATSATNDGSGNVISSTYGKLGATNEWSEINTFDKSIRLLSDFTLGVIPQSIKSSSVVFRNSTEPSQDIRFIIETTGETYTSFRACNKFTSGALSPTGSVNISELKIGVSSGGEKYIWANGLWQNNISPYANNTYNLGTSSNMWSDIWVANTDTKYLGLHTTLKTKGVAPSGSGRNNTSIAFRDPDYNLLGKIEHNCYSSGDSFLEFSVENNYTNGALDPNGSNVSNSLQLYLGRTGDRSFFPSYNNEVYLGASNNQWKSVYAQTYYYNGTAWGLDKANTWTGSNTFTSQIVEKFSTSDLSNYVDIIQCLNTDNQRVVSFRTTHNSDYRILTIGVHDNANSAPKGLSIENDGSNHISVYSQSASQQSYLGTSTYPWKAINGINPGSLSFPSGGTTENTDWYNVAGDILPTGGNATNFTGGQNFFTPSKDGWLALSVVNCESLAVWISSLNYGLSVVAPNTNENRQLIIPVVAGKQVEIKVKGSLWHYARLIVTQGNV